MDEITTGIDRISQLPEPILQHILFFLTAKDAARTTILSRTWSHLWASLPIFSFDLDESSFREPMVFRGKELSYTLVLQSERQERSFQVDKELLSLVEDSLIRLHGQKCRIQRFRLVMMLHDCKLFPSVDHWIELVTKNYIRELELDFRNGREDDRKENDWYSLPQATFAANSLMVLTLSGCKLKQALFSETTKFACLQELSLVNVLLDEEIVRKLIFSCPSIENFSFTRCYGVKHLLVSNLTKLKKVAVDQGNSDLCEIQRIEIEAPNLERLYYRGRNILFEIDVGPFRYLKELVIVFAQITNQLFEDIISKLPLLEILALRFCFKLERVKISSQLLKKLCLCLFDGLVEAEIDTPNLLSLEYAGGKLPSVFQVNAPTLQEGYVKFILNHKLDTLWFVRLREFLGKFNQLKALSFHISSINNTFIPEELREFSVPPPSGVNKLDLEYIGSALDYASLLNGLLWSCHPETLTVVTGQGPNNELIKFLCKKLIINAEKNLICCGSSCTQCWWHNIKGIEMESSAGTEDMKGLHYVALLESLPTLEPGQEIRFILKWL